MQTTALPGSSSSGGRTSKSSVKGASPNSMQRVPLPGSNKGKSGGSGVGSGKGGCGPK
jgi:hypothetical protein